MPDYAGKEDIKQALIYAWRQGLKGLTIYRTGSRQHVVLSLKEPKVELIAGKNSVKETLNQLLYSVILLKIYIH